MNNLELAAKFTQHHTSFSLEFDTIKNQIGHNSQDRAIARAVGACSRLLTILNMDVNHLRAPSDGLQHKSITQAYSICDKSWPEAIRELKYAVGKAGIKITTIALILTAGVTAWIAGRSQSPEA